MREFVVTLAVIFLLFAAFMAFFELKKVTVANYKKYPPTTSCGDLYTIF